MKPLAIVIANALPNGNFQYYFLADDLGLPLWTADATLAPQYKQRAAVKFAKELTERGYPSIPAVVEVDKS